MRCKLACISIFLSGDVYAGRRELLVFMFHENKKTVWLNVMFSQS